MCYMYILYEYPWIPTKEIKVDTNICAIHGYLFSLHEFPGILTLEIKVDTHISDTHGYYFLSTQGLQQMRYPRD
jgi:hypothetical protein